MMGLREKDNVKSGPGHGHKDGLAAASHGKRSNSNLVFLDRASPLPFNIENQP